MKDKPAEIIRFRTPVNFRFDNLEYGCIETRHIVAELVHYFCELENTLCWQVRWPNGKWSEDDVDIKFALDNAAMDCPLLKEWGWRDVARSYNIVSTNG